VLAHPRYMKDPEALLVGLQGAGLAGLEAYHKDSDPETVDRFKAMAERFGLLPTGGSDYHALPREQEREPGNTPFLDSAAHAFLERYLPWVPTSELS
jgi:3',5'-nucleoside bisphosphate phosphatase